MDFVNERIANLSGGVGVIYVGALSDIEQKYKIVTGKLII